MAASAHAHAGGVLAQAFGLVCRRRALRGDVGIASLRISLQLLDRMLAGRT